MTCYIDNEDKIVFCDKHHNHLANYDIIICCDQNTYGTDFNVTISNNKLTVNIVEDCNPIYSEYYNHLYEYNMDGIINIKYYSMGVFVVYVDKVVHLDPIEKIYYVKDILTPNTQIISSCDGIVTLQDNILKKYNKNGSLVVHKLYNDNSVLLRVNQKYMVVSNDNGNITSYGQNDIVHANKISDDIYMILFNHKNEEWYIVDFGSGKYVKTTEHIKSCIHHCSNFEFCGNKLLFDVEPHDCGTCETSVHQFIDCFNKYGRSRPSNFNFDKNLFIYNPPIKSARKIH